MSRRRPPAPEICPVCGEDVPRNALACRHCGADHNSGWREDADVYDGTDVPEDSFDYDEFVRQEFGGRTGKLHSKSWLTMRPGGLHLVWWLTALLLLAAFFVIYFRPFFP